MASEIVLKPSPVGVDVMVNVIQNALYKAKVTNGAWTNYKSYHRAYKNETSEGIRPEVFTGSGNEYRDVFNNDDFTATSFFLISDETEISDGMYTADISIIFQVNLDLLYPSSVLRFDEEFKNEIDGVLKKLDGRFSFDKTIDSIDGVYAGLDTSKVNWDNMDKFHVVRFELTANYQHQCGVAFATKDCTVKVDEVATTPESTAGANDGTATAVVILEQGNLSYLWNDPAEQTTVTATGLGAGTFTVTVTDDNVLIPACTDTGSGTVIVAPLPPECDLNILTVTNTPPATFGGSDGTATVTFADNVGVGAVEWDASASNQITVTATGLSAGKVCVKVTDSLVLGCSKMGSTTLADGPVEFKNPDDLDNIMFWMDAGVNSSLNGGSAADLVPIALTAPISPAIYSMDQATTGNQPIYHSTGFGPNNLPYIQFVASSGHSLRNTDFVSSTSLSFIIIARADSLLASVNLIDNVIAGGAGLRLFYETSNGDLRITLTTNAGPQNNTNMTVGDDHIFSGRMNLATGLLDVKIDDGAYTSVVAITKNTSTLTLGAKASSPNSENFDGAIPEFMWWRELHTEADLDLVVVGLKTKYGLTY